MSLSNQDRNFIRQAVGVITDRLDILINISQRNSRLLKESMVEIDELTTEVAANTDATSAVSTVVGRLADAFEASKDDPAQVQALVDQVRANNQALTDAALLGTGVLDEPGGEEPPA